MSTGKRQYLVKWEGYSDLYSTWENEQNLDEVGDWIREYREEMNALAGKRTSKKPNKIAVGQVKKVKRKIKKPRSAPKMEQSHLNWPQEKQEEELEQHVKMEVQDSVHESISDDDQQIIEICHTTKSASVSKSHVDGRDIQNHNISIDGIRYVNGILMYQTCYQNKRPIWTDKECFLLANPEKLLHFYLSHLK